jgi:hypothetical protein
MIDRYRIYIANFIAPLVGLLVFFFIWLQPSAKCNLGHACFGKLPVSVVLIVTFLFYAAMFLTGISKKAREHYVETGLPFWRLAVASAHLPLLATMEVSIFVLFSQRPVTTYEWLNAAFVVALPLIAACALYISWYLIVGRQNKQIKFDALKERTFVA